MTRREHQAQKEVVYLERESYKLVKRHFSLFPTHFDVSFHALKRCLWVHAHDSKASRAELFDNLVRLAEFMSEFALLSIQNVFFIRCRSV